jgi:hypothetical protein
MSGPTDVGEVNWVLLEDTGRNSFLRKRELGALSDVR